MRVIKQGTVSDSNENTAYSFFSRNKERFNDIILTSTGKKISLPGVKEILFVGGETSSGAGSVSKTDVRIIYSEGTYNISLKKRSFQAWQSVDTLAGDRISEKILGYLMDDINGFGDNRTFDIISYTDGGRIKYKIVKKRSDSTTKIAFKCSRADASTVIFGTDIMGKGSVVTAEFPGACLLKDNLLTIKCANIIETMSDVRSDVYPYFSIKSSFSSKTRNTHRFPGLRAQAVPKRELKGSVEFLPEL
jgi:hypothetical protein